MKNNKIFYSVNYSIKIKLIRKCDKVHKSSFRKMKYFKDTYLNADKELKILDIGSFDKEGDFNYGIIFKSEKWTYHGLDLKEGNNVDIVLENPYEWNEIPDESYDVIVSGQAFEHIEFFWLTLEQIKRILKPEGFLFIIAPSTGPIHRNPFDCYRFNEDGMKSMGKYINFDVIEYGTNFDESASPWQDSYLVAKKPESGSTDDLENKVYSLEQKLDIIIDKINNS